MTRKKIIFVIVEGVSDEDALGVIFSRIYDSNAVYVHVTHGDITAKFNNAPNKNIYMAISDEIRSYAKSNHFRKTDFKEIVHIIDMDGAYIPNDNVIEDATARNPKYSLTEIYTCNKQGIEKRNEMKRGNIDNLCSRNEIWGIPYRAFYMSCNLDHVLYDKQNSSDEEKESDSLDFAKYYKNQIIEFISFVSDSEFSVMGGYKESWDFIKQDLHSLERHSNLGICFTDVKNS